MTRSFVVVLAGLAVALAAFLHYHDSTSAPSLTLPFVYSPNEEALLGPLIDRYNDEHHSVGGIRVVVAGESVSSGEAEAKIAGRASRPVIWSPASSLWGRLLDYQADAAWAPRTSPSLVKTPLVIALWPQEARALGWPEKPIGFGQILELATSKRGWAAYGLPAFGAFKLGHTNPDFSTSGLSFVAAEYYTATGKRSDLTVADVRRADVRMHVRQVQQSIVHYGDTGSFFVDQLKQHGPGYISAVAMEEVSLLDYNRTRGSAAPLVAVYPSEGTFYFDNPLITLRAPWVTAPETRAAAAFVRWLAAAVSPALAARYGYRPGNAGQPPVAPIDRKHFVDPAQPRVVLPLPEPRVLAAIKQAWHEDRKAANVAVVVDVSGSMGTHHRLEEAQRGLRVFLRQFSPRDRVGLFTFSDVVTTLVPIGEIRLNRPVLSASVDTLIAAGNTAVYDATREGVAAVAALGDDTRINAVVVLTDGEDTSSRTSARALIDSLQRTAEDQEHNIRVFTIAYGGEANQKVLASIAAASGGKGYTGDPDEIAAVYREISSFF
jgi:Ca-activated chloride channel family protein